MHMYMYMSTISDGSRCRKGGGGGEPHAPTPNVKRRANAVMTNCHISYKSTFWSYTSLCWKYPDSASTIQAWCLVHTSVRFYFHPAFSYFSHHLPPESTAAMATPYHQQHSRGNYHSLLSSRETLSTRGHTARGLRRVGGKDAFPNSRNVWGCR